MYVQWGRCSISNKLCLNFKGGVCVGLQREVEMIHRSRDRERERDRGTMVQDIEEEDGKGRHREQHEVSSSCLNLWFQLNIVVIYVTLL